VRFDLGFGTCHIVGSGEGCCGDQAICAPNLEAIRRELDEMQAAGGGEPKP
jgi:hypothetical protein